MKAKMPDKYERMAQLRQILRHMFDIGQEFYQELQNLLEQNTALEAARAKLEGQVKELKSELNDVRSTMAKKLAAEKASFEKSLADKNTLIDGLNEKNIKLEQAYTNILKDLKDEQFFHANIEAMKLLDREKQNYELKREKLTEKENELDTKENDLTKAYEAYKKAWKHLKEQQADCEEQARRNKEERLELEAERLELDIALRRASQAGGSGGESPIPPKTPPHDFANTIEKKGGFPHAGEAERKEPADLPEQWQAENQKNVEPGTKSAAGQNYDPGTTRPANPGSPLPHRPGDGMEDGLGGGASQVDHVVFAGKGPMKSKSR